MPNIYGTMGHKVKTRKHPGHGTQCVLQYPTNRNPAQSLQENATTVFGPRLYNSLPKYLRDMESIKTENFKFELAKFLQLIPDQPKMPNYVTASGIKQQHPQPAHLSDGSIGSYQSGGIPDSAMEHCAVANSARMYLFCAVLTYLDTWSGFEAARTATALEGYFLKSKQSRSILIN